MEPGLCWSSNISTASSSDGESGSSCSEDSEEADRMEEVLLEGQTVVLPQALCESHEIFKEFMSLDLFKNMSEANKQHLMKYLPSFPENDVQEKEITLQKLFNRENFRFGNPLTDFHKKLQAGYYRPDICRMRALLKKAHYRHYKQQQRRYYYHLLKSILISRHKLLESASRGGPGTIPRSEKMPVPPPRPSAVQQRVRRRYFQELTAVREEVGESELSSEDENYPEGPPLGLNKKQRRQLAYLEQSLSPDLRPVTSTLSSKPSGLDLEHRVTPSHNPYDISEDAYKDMLTRHRKRRLNGEEHPDLLTRGITLNEVISRCQINKKQPPVRESKVPVKKAKTKPTPSVNTMPEEFEVEHSSDTDGGEDDDGEMEKVDIEGDDDQSFPHTPIANRKTIPSAPATPTSLSSLNSSPRSGKSGGVMLTTRRIVKLEPPEDQTTNLLPPPPPAPLPKPKPKPPAPPPVSRHVIPATLSDLDGIDMMDLPVDLEDSEITIDDMKPRLELMQETYASFFSLLRDIICSTPDHRMSLAQLEDRVKAWAESPISPLNDWYSMAVLDIRAWLTSSLAFLAGEYTEWQPEEFVPYLDYKPALRVYQWIGAGRDTDTHLTPLCRLWLERREEMVSHPVKEEESDLERQRLLAASPPPPRFPTSWVVTPSTPEERESFREQERLRYENPHKAFTYRMHGYESVVGPVKGMYYQAVGQIKPRGHTLLTDGRPNYVTILALVRDATARLPNGQGTRSDICTLLRDSQYLASHAPDSDLNSVVSGALDRLHYETDPCVKYDTKRKIWIYLHRGRTEDEFERIHQKQQKSGKPKSTRKTQRSKNVTASSPNQVKTEAGTTAGKAPTKSAKAAAAAAARVQAAAATAQVVTSSTGIQSIISEANIVSVADDKLLSQTKPVTTQRLPTSNVQKSLITAATLAAKKASLAAQKATTENEVKSILGKPNRQKSLQTVKSVKGVKQTPQTMAPVRRLPEGQTGSVVAAVRRAAETQAKVATSVAAVTSASVTTLTTTVATSATTTVLSAVRRLPDQLKLASQTGTTRIKTLKAGKEATSLLDQAQIQSLNKVAVGSCAISSTPASQGIVKAVTTPAKSVVKVVTSQSGVRAVASTAQVTQQQMMLIKQQLLNEQKQQAAQQQVQPQQTQQTPQQQTAQQLIVMKQSTSADQSAGGTQPQMIVINQQQLMTDQQLTAKQQKQLQQILVKQQLEQANITIQQQQLQQLFLAKQQQLITEQQKTGKAQQPMFVVKQQTQTTQQQQQLGQQQTQQVQTTQQQVVDSQKTQLQPMIFVKQQQIIGAETQITQQQLQQMLLLKQQQQKQQKQETQQQMVLVKQQTGEQQKVAVSVQQQTKQAQVAAVAQAQQLTLAQLQQLQQQQQGQRLVTSASLLTQPRVVSSVGGQTVLSAGGTSLIKTQQTPMVAKVVTNAQGQPVLSMESLLAHQKQHGALPQGTALRVATAASKPGLPPQYTVVTMAQPRVIQANAVSQATTVCSTSAAVGGTATATQLQVQTTKGIQPQQQQGTTATGNIRMSGLNLTHIGGKPVLLASKPQSLQAQNVILASQAGSSGQTVLLAPQGLRGTTPPTGTLTVLQQGTQQILLPPGFQGGTLNIKTLQGLKVIPLAQTTTSAKGTGRQQVFARIINPGSVRPVVANIVQDTSVTNPQPPPTSME